MFQQDCLMLWVCSNNVSAVMMVCVLEDRWQYISPAWPKLALFILSIIPGILVLTVLYYISSIYCSLYIQCFTLAINYSHISNTFLFKLAFPSPAISSRDRPSVCSIEPNELFYSTFFALNQFLVRINFHISKHRPRSLIGLEKNASSQSKFMYQVCPQAVGKLCSFCLGIACLKLSTSWNKLFIIRCLNVYFNCRITRFLKLWFLTSIF